VGGEGPRQPANITKTRRPSRKIVFFIRTPCRIGTNGGLRTRTNLINVSQALQFFTSFPTSSGGAGNSWGKSLNSFRLTPENQPKAKTS